MVSFLFDAGSTRFKCLLLTLCARFVASLLRCSLRCSLRCLVLLRFVFLRVSFRFEHTQTETLEHESFRFVSFCSKSSLCLLRLVLRGAPGEENLCNLDASTNTTTTYTKRRDVTKKLPELFLAPDTSIEPCTSQNVPSRKRKTSKKRKMGNLNPGCTYPGLVIYLKL